MQNKFQPATWCNDPTLASALFQCLDVPLVLLTSDFHTVEINTAARTSLGLSLDDPGTVPCPSTLLGLQHRDLNDIHESLNERGQWCAVRTCLSADKWGEPSILTVRPLSDSVLLCRIQSLSEGLAAEQAPETDPQDVSVELVVRNLRLQALYETSARQVSTDPLTQTASRYQFLRELDRVVAQFSFQARPFSLAIIDVDHFKVINDTMGHLEGDEALRNLGALLRHSFRSSDIVGRIGGEEFAVLMEWTPIERARDVVERVRSQVASATLCKRPFTVSIGLVSHTEGECAPKKLLDRADQALYAAKRAGRNQVVDARELDAAA